jgi:hypothetical protein
MFRYYQQPGIPEERWFVQLVVPVTLVLQQRMLRAKERMRLMPTLWKR